MMIDITKKYRTRNNMSVTLMTDKGHIAFPIIGYIEEDEGPSAWTIVGKYFDCTLIALDLIEVREPRVCWVNFYSNGTSEKFESKERADTVADVFYTRIGKAIKVVMEVPVEE